MKTENTTSVYEITTYIEKRLGRGNDIRSFCQDLYDTDHFYPLDNLPYKYPEFSIYGPNDEDQEKMVKNNVIVYDLKANPLELNDRDLLKIAIHQYAFDTIGDLDTEFRILH